MIPRKIAYLTLCKKCGYLMALCKRDDGKEIGTINLSFTDADQRKCAIYVLHLKTHLGEEEYEKNTSKQVIRYDIS